MRKAKVYVNNVYAGILLELEYNKKYAFKYIKQYNGPPVSLTMPIQQKEYEYTSFPPFFEGLLPEGIMLDALCRTQKTDKKDFFGQLLIVGNDVVGTTTIEKIS